MHEIFFNDYNKGIQNRTLYRNDIHKDLPAKAHLLSCVMNWKRGCCGSMSPIEGERGGARRELLGERQQSNLQMMKS